MVKYFEKTVVESGIKDSEYCIKKNHKLNFIFIGTDSVRSKKLIFRLNGENSSLNFFGFLTGRADKIFNFSIEAYHKAKNTKSAVHLQSALYDESKVDFKGILNIGSKASFADCYLSHNTLLLSEKARAHTQPVLEILTDDVKAGHGATVGKVSKEDLFYLNTRGIGNKMAGQLLVVGFFEKQLAMIEDVDLRNSVRQAIIKSLPF